MAGAADNPETLLDLPWGIDPATSWLGYRSWVETELDPGMALHKPLPQSDYAPDTLAVIGAQSPVLDANTPAQGGVNLKPNAPVVDVVQRMATSTYRFVLRGYGLRAGYQVPIPGLVSVGGITAVPDNPQRAYNVIVGEFSGVPIWYATWELHYFLAQTPSPGAAQVPVPFNPALHIRSDAVLPQTIDVPVTVPETGAQPIQKPLGPGGGIPIQKPLLPG